MSTTIEFLADLGEKLQTQDNLYTASPNYCIQENRLHCGIDEDYGGEIGWFGDGAYHPAEGKKKLALDRYYRMYDKEPNDWTRCGYEFKWRYTGINFLTKDAADAYVARQSHRHTYEVRVYVDSHYRNREMKEVRRLLAGPVQACIKALVLASNINPYGSVENQKARDEAIAALAELETAQEPHQ